MYNVQTLIYIPLPFVLLKKKKKTSTTLEKGMIFFVFLNCHLLICNSKILVPLKYITQLHYYPHLLPKYSCKNPKRLSYTCLNANHPGSSHSLEGNDYYMLIIIVENNVRLGKVKQAISTRGFIGAKSNIV